jgi:hypothetical protein
MFINEIFPSWILVSSQTTDQFKFSSGVSGLLSRAAAAGLDPPAELASTLDHANTGDDPADGTSEHQYRHGVANYVVITARVVTLHRWPDE